MAGSKRLLIRGDVVTVKEIVVLVEEPGVSMHIEIQYLEMHIIKCVVTSISITKCPLPLLVNFAIISGKNFEHQRS